MISTSGPLDERGNIRATSWFQPILEVVWVERTLHEEALTALLAAAQPSISLTDWTSFLIMRERGIEVVFSFDRHFARQGFRPLPSIFTPAAGDSPHTTDQA